MPFNSDPRSTQDSPEQVDTEAGVRRALGLDGPASSGERPPPQQQAFRPSGGFSSGGFSSDRPKRRFVQDGEVPVVIVHGRRDQGGQTIEPRGGAGAPPTNRLEVAERALRAEREVRETAERALAEAQALIRDLQTKIGHAALARDEHRAGMLRAEAERAVAEAALAEEREARVRADQARARVEEALAVATAAAHVVAAPRVEPVEDAAPVAKRRRGRPPRQAAENHPIAVAPRMDDQPVFAVTDAAVPAQKAARERVARTKIDAAATTPARMAKAARAADATGPEPKPVRWWIKPKKPAGRRGTTKAD